MSTQNGSRSHSDSRHSARLTRDYDSLAVCIDELFADISRERLGAALAEAAETANERGAAANARMTRSTFGVVDANERARLLADDGATDDGQTAELAAAVAEFIARPLPDGDYEIYPYGLTFAEAVVTLAAIRDHGCPLSKELLPTADNTDVPGAWLAMNIQARVAEIAARPDSRLARGFLERMANEFVRVECALIEAAKAADAGKAKSAGESGASGAPPADLIPIARLREIVPNRIAKGSASHLATWIRRRGHETPKVAGKLHVARAVAIRLFPNLHDLIAKI